MNDNYKKLRLEFLDLLGSMRETISCDIGWYSLVRELCEKLQSISKEIRITCIKEKWAALRVYITCPASLQEALNLVDEYEEKSRAICEACGKPSTDMYKKHDGGWLRTLCSDCATNLAFDVFPDCQMKSMLLGAWQASDGLAEA